MRWERGFLILKGDFERKSVNEKAPGRVDARLGASVYRSVKWGNEQGTESACPPSPPAAKRRGWENGCNREPSPVTLVLPLVAVANCLPFCQASSEQHQLVHPRPRHKATGVGKWM